MNSNSSSVGPGQNLSRRTTWLILCAFFAFLIIVGRLWFLQVIHGDRFFQTSTHNIVQEIDVKSSRGRIYDAHGVALADNRPSFDVYLIPSIYRKYARQNTMTRLKSYLNLSDVRVNRIERRVHHKLPEIVVRRDITREQVALIKANGSLLPGVEVRANAHRTYPLHTVGAHALGFLGTANKQELEDLKTYGYASGDYIGRMGIERAFEAILHGSPGLERRVVDARGNPQSEAETDFLVGDYKSVKPVAGRDIVVSLDTELMLMIDEAMRPHPSGAVVALDPRDGTIKALYSKPSFDPNSWTGRLSSQEKLRSDNDIYKPMLDKTVSTYFPGSVYKIVGALAALEEDIMTEEDEVMCGGRYRFGGRWFRCWKRAGHKHVNVEDSISESCDVYFYKTAELLGIDTLADYSYRFGFGEPSGLPINNESGGRVPTKEWYRKNGPDGYQFGFALNTVIGQGDTLTSPLQIALAYAAIANGGNLYAPSLIKEVRNRDGEVLYSFPPRLRKRIEFNPKHLQAIQRGLWGTVNTENGTAYKVRLKDVEVAGKTGTAQVHKIGKVRIANRDKAIRFRDHAWFASYAPADDPELVIVVFIQHGGHGGSVAAPVAMQIYDKYFHRDPSRPLTARISDQAAKLRAGGKP